MRHAAARLAWRYALPAMVGLALIGRIGAIVTLPPEFAALAISTGLGGRGNAVVLSLVGAAVVLALAISAVVAASRPRRRPPVWPATMLSVSAGVSEELFFRLFLPLLIALATGSAVMGFAIGLTLFVVAHRHQGARGMADVAVAGTGFTLIYLATGMLWAAMVVHIVVDLNALLVRGRGVRGQTTSGPGAGRSPPGR